MLPGQWYFRMRGQRRGREPAGPRVELLRVALQEPARQHGDVVAALAQRRQADGDHVQAVVEVLAEAAGADLVLQVPVGGGEHADVDGLARASRRRAGPRAPGWPAGASPGARAASRQSRRGRGCRRRPPGSARRGSATAPVKAPFTWPKSSLSSSPSGMARAVDGDEGAGRRAAERRWISRATSSLPVPVSPWMSTVTSVGATFSMRR